MIRLILFILFTSLPVGVLAQVVAVRSGEHGDFSRLVFSFPTPVEWKMGRISRGYEIRLQEIAEKIDISGVYQRISRKRIKNISVSSGNSSVTLVVDCLCHADAFEFRPGLLVVDIKDGPPDGQSPFETSFSADETGDVALVETTTESGDPQTHNMAEGSVISANLQENETAPGSSKPIVPFGEQLVLKPEITPEASHNIKAMQSEMLRQIGRAAAHGLLEANLPKSFKEVQSEQVPEAATVSEEKPHVNIRIENSVDREFPKILSQSIATESDDTCLGEGRVNISDWGGEDNIWEQISEQRRKLSGEFDRINPVAVENLAKAYIYAGFGAEAIQAINSFNLETDTAHILKEMALIVDGFSSQKDSIFKGQLGCDSPVALWAVLSLRVLPKGATINKPHVISAFSALPLHMRRFLGPRLAEEFLDAGDIDAATSIRNAIARAPGDAGDEFRLMEARFDQKRGHVEAAEQTFAKIATNNNSVAIEALINLLEAKTKNKSDVSEEMLTTAESYLFEQKTSEAGARLLQSIALVRAQSGDLGAALEKLRVVNVNNYISEKEKRALWGDVLEAAVYNATDEEFLKFIFTARKEIKEQDVSRTAHQMIANRLLDLGFSTQALQLLNAPVPPTEIDRLILARAAILGDKSNQVEKLLSNITGEEATRLRAQAFESLGFYDRAAEEFAAISDRDGQKAAIWRAGDWQNLQKIGSDPEKTLARLMVSDALEAETKWPPSENVLTKDASLIEESGHFRQSIEALIRNFPIPSLTGG